MTRARYANLDPTHRPHPAREVFRWAVLDKVLRRRRRAPRRAPVPWVENDGAALRANRALPSLTWLGHASWLVQIAGVHLVTDPVFGDLAGGLLRRNVPVGVEPSALPTLHAVLVSHNHYDHLDRKSVAALPEGAAYVVPAGLGPWFRRLGKTDVRELGWWDRTRVGEATVTFVPARHWSRRGLWDVNRSWWGGFVIGGDGHTVYFAGDTAYFSGFAEIGRRFPNLDAALLPIGAYDPEWFMRQQHLSPEDAVMAYRDLGARLFCAMHWGTFKLTDEPLDEPPYRLAAAWEAAGLRERDRWVPAVGETRWLGERSRPESERRGAPA